MKIVLITGIAVLLFAFSNKGKYPVVKLYAYQQKVSKGANFSTSDKKTSPTIKHHVYIEVRENEHITISRVWLNGKKIAFDTLMVHSPVTIEKSVKFGKNAYYDTLVPETKNNIIQVALNYTQQIESQKIPYRFKKYQILLEYKAGYKRYFLGSASFKELDPEVNQ